MSVLKMKKENLKNKRKIPDQVGSDIWKVGNDVRKADRRWSIISLAWELGYLITIPIVLLAFGGKLLDDKLNTSPWMLLTGIIISIIITSWLVYKKTISVIKEQ